jgi:hypothetical protein
LHEKNIINFKQLPPAKRRNTVFLQANAYGKPVIGGNAGGVPSAIKKRLQWDVGR